MSIFETIRSLDWIAASCMLLLLLLGLAMLVSATYTEGIISGLFIRQAISAAIALVAFTAMAHIHYDRLRSFAPLLYVLGLGGLLTLTVFGITVRGTISRLSLFGVQLQPSEFMKIGLLMMLAWLATRLPNPSWKFILLTGLITALPTSLVLLEPDTGMAGLLILTWAGILIFMGTSWPKLLIILALGAASLFAAWQWLFLDYQKARLFTFLNPAADPLGAGYNITQSIVALGSGQLLGRGLGHGPQSQLKFLPERHTDFILSSIGEELGLVGIMLVLILYSVLLWRLIKIAQNTSDAFGRNLAISAFFILLVGVAVSAGMNMGLLPVTGIPLPLVSFGGSSLLSTLILLGIAQSVRLHGRWKRLPPTEISHIN